MAKNCTVGRSLREHIATLNENDTVLDATRVMTERRIGSVLVSRDDDVVGVFSERDLVRRVVGAGMDASQVKLGDVCTHDLISIPGDTECHRAINIMASKRVRRLLVHQANRFVGMVTLTDLAHDMAKGRRRNDIVLNTLGALTVMVAVVVVVLMLTQLPNVLQLSGAY